MTKSQFIAKTISTPCEDCPITIFCEACDYFSCGQVASRYYNTHKDERGVFKCPEKDLSKTESSST